MPAVLTRGEVKAVIDRIRSVSQLVCRLLCGAGLRVTECLGLRAKDIDFERCELCVRGGNPRASG